MMRTRVPHDLPAEKKFNQKQQKLFFTKDLLVKKDPDEKFVCFSNYLKGKLDIPDEWAVCESGVDVTLSQEDWDSKNFSYVNKFHAINSNIQVCLKCVYKWKLFEHDPTKDYTVFNSQKKI